VSAVGSGPDDGDILLRSNFGAKGPVAVGSMDGIGPFGQRDMAGNVKEWCWNESTGGRMILGLALCSKGNTREAFSWKRKKPGQEWYCG